MEWFLPWREVIDMDEQGPGDQIMCSLFLINL